MCFNVVLDPRWMMLLFTSNQDLFPPYWLDHCRDNFIEMLRQNYDDKDSRSMIVSQPTLLLNDADDLFSNPLLVDQLAEDASGNSIEDELGRYLNDGRYKPGTGEDKSPLHWWRDNERRFPRCRRENGLICDPPLYPSFGPQNITVITSQKFHHRHAFFDQISRNSFSTFPQN